MPGKRYPQMVTAPPSSYELVNVGYGTLVGIWITFGITTLIFWARIFVQMRIVRRLGIDDYLMLAAWVRFHFLLMAMVVDLTYLGYSFYILYAPR